METVYTYDDVYFISVQIIKPYYKLRRTKLFSPKESFTRIMPNAAILFYKTFQMIEKDKIIVITHINYL